MRIDVTKDDIEWGIVGSCKECPVALAVSRMATGPVSVNAVYIYAGDKCWATPPEVGEFIEGFDDGLNVKPFSFELPDNRGA